MTASSLLEYGLASNVPHPGLGFRRCYRAEVRFHGVEYLLCDCLRTELPVEARAKSSGRLGTPERNHTCEECGGEFTYDGCSRVVGWCMGAGDDLGEEHCDDCYCDRLAVLELIHSEGQQSRTSLRLRMGANAAAWRRPPDVVARELCEDGFLTFNGAGRFALTERGRAAL